MDGECVRVTRASSKKRAFEVSLQHQAVTKKRIILGEITTFDDFDLISPDSKSIQKKPVAADEVKSHSDDPQMCEVYASDIYEYLHSMEMENKRRPIRDYIEKIQKDVTAQMRGVLVDWLVEVAEEYRLLPETLYLTVSYLDRYLSLNSLNRKRLQLLGVSCMLIASKYEEITPPDVEDFVYITDNTYTKQDLVKMEADVLKSLNFEMGNPTVFTFLQRYTATPCKTPDLLQLEFLGRYLAELSLLDYDCIRFVPSLVAASVIFLANFTIHQKMHPWSSILQEQSGYVVQDLKDCVLTIHDLQLGRKGSSLEAIRAKYRQSRFKCVAKMTSPSEIPSEYFEDVRL